MMIDQSSNSLPQVQRRQASSAYRGDRRRSACRPRRTFRASTKRGCPGSTSRSGTGCGRRRARRRRSIAKLTAAVHGGAGRSGGAASASPSSGWTSRRASSRRRKALARATTRPRSRSGGRSSRRRTSRGMTGATIGGDDESDSSARRLRRCASAGCGHARSRRRAIPSRPCASWSAFRPAPRPTSRRASSPTSSR